MVLPIAEPPNGPSWRGATPRAGTGIIELTPVHWQTIADAPEQTLADPTGGQVRYRHEPEGFAGYLFDGGGRIEAPLGRCSFSPAGHWFALEARPGVLLWDRERDVFHRLRRRRLCGWHAEQPWLQGGNADMPPAAGRCAGARDEHADAYFD